MLEITYRNHAKSEIAHMDSYLRNHFYHMKCQNGPYEV